jgi:pimeloyl-ACP methyl ester carboxylesterase
MKPPKPKLNRIRIYSLLLFTMMFLITVGALFQTISEFIDLRRYSPRGTLVEIQDYSLHLFCLGVGTPTIILESDLSYNSLQWYAVQRILSKQTKVCSYDRAGLGWSDRSPIPRTGIDMTEELYRILRKDAKDGPYVIVGYNRGAWLARLFAYTYPEEMNGIVLISPSIDDEASPPEANFFQSVQDRLMPVITWLGITRFSVLLGGMDAYRAPFSTLPQGIQSENIALSINRIRYWQAAAQELEAIPIILEDLSTRSNLAAVPLVVVVSEEQLSRQEPDGQSDIDLQPDLEKFTEIAATSLNGSIVLCENCGSMPPTTSPETIAAIILQAVAQMGSK